MLSKSDPYYGAILVEQARLHLGTVMAGQDSEPFFMTMLQIAEANVHYGYTTFKDKEVRLKGIKDFMYSVYYGLGLKDVNSFVIACIKSAMKEKSKNQYGNKFIDWLKTQDEIFKFPPEFFEYRRLASLIGRNRKRSKYKKALDIKTLRFLYQTAPNLLEQIGYGRKYRSVEQCYYMEGYGEKKRSLKPIKTYENPNIKQIEFIGKDLFERLGIAKSRLLALKLLNLCANARSAGAGGSAADSRDFAARPDWAD